MKTRLSSLLLLVIAGIASLHAWQLSRVLPDRVASHFNAAGHANGWMSRAGFVATYLGVVVFLTAMFLAISSGLQRMPEGRINLPRKAYWLDPVRRSETVAWLRGWFQWMGAATLLLVVSIMHLAARVNLGLVERLGRAAPRLLIAYLTFTGLMVAVMILRFARPPKEAK